MLGAFFTCLIDESDFLKSTRLIHVIHFFILTIFEQTIIKLNIQLFDIPNLELSMARCHQCFKVRPNCKKAENRSSDPSDQTIQANL